MSPAPEARLAVAGRALAAVLAGAGVEPARAEGALPEDVAAIEACLAADAPGARCIGAVRGPCMTQPGGETTVGIVQCTARETAAWDALLNRFYAALREFVQEPARTTLRDAQRAWIIWRDADCRFAAEQFAGGSLARVTAATCLMDRTAERALHLGTYIQDGN